MPGSAAATGRPAGGVTAGRRSTAASPFATVDANGEANAARIVSRHEYRPGSTDGEDLVLSFTGTDIDSGKELTLTVDGEPYATLSRLGDLPTLGVFDRFGPVGDATPIPAQVRLPAELIDADTVIGFEHWSPDDSWGVVDVRMRRASDTAGGNISSDGSIIADAANGANQREHEHRRLEQRQHLHRRRRTRAATNACPIWAARPPCPMMCCCSSMPRPRSRSSPRRKPRVAVAPGAAAAGATGASVVAAAGDFAMGASYHSVATSTSASDVIRSIPSIYLEIPSDSDNEEAQGAAKRADTGAASSGIAIVPSLALDGSSEPSAQRRVRERPALAGMGLSEAEAESEGEVELKAAVSNNAAAAAAIAGGGAGATGLAATGRVSAATSTNRPPPRAAAVG